MIIRESAQPTAAQELRGASVGTTRTAPTRAADTAAPKTKTQLALEEAIWAAVQEAKALKELWAEMEQLAVQGQLAAHSTELRLRAAMAEAEALMGNLPVEVRELTSSSSPIRAQV